MAIGTADFQPIEIVAIHKEFLWRWLDRTAKKSGRDYAFFWDTCKHQCHVSLTFFFFFFQECTDSLLNQLDQQLKITEDECKHYRESLEQLGEGTTQEEDDQVLEKEIEQVGVGV